MWIDCRAWVLALASFSASLSWHLTRRMDTPLYLVRSTGCALFDRTAKQYPPPTVLILDFECTDRGILRPRCLFRSERTVLVYLQRLEDVNIPARQTFPGRSALSTMSTVTMRDDGWAIRTSCPSLWRRSRTCVM